jgi:pantoate--beta-alanine ligase
LRTVNEVRALRAQYRKEGKTVGFVPTMGALHNGHLQLMQTAKQCDKVIASIFVNPKQFAPTDDFASYPRPFESDCEKLKSVNVDAVFAPEWKEMYPESPPYGTYVTIEKIDEIGEGKSRPGFFRGVATVVTKLFNTVQPTKAYFGQKDGLQSIVIRRIVRDLNMDLDVVICPTIREPDGLAMSSRNVYLSPVQRAASPVIYQSLIAAEKAYAAANASKTAVTCNDIRNHMLQVLQRADPNILTYPPQYISFADTYTGAEFEDNATLPNEDILLSIAVKCGKTRLIDNTILKKHVH